MFPSEEDALEFLEDYDLDEARVKLLKVLGRVLEAAEIHVKNDDVLKAVEILSAPTTYSGDHARPAIEYLLTGLRQGLTLGVLPESDSIVSKLLVLADRLDNRTMTGPEVSEASPSCPFNYPIRRSYALASAVRDVQRDPMC